MGIEIKSPGLLTTIQDGGRFGFRKYGVIVSGAMDQIAFRVSNLLVGNKENDAVLEITLLGPEILIKEDTLISICGGDLSPKINEDEVPMWRPIYVKAGSVLSFGKCRSGTRAYVAFAGSFHIEEVMGSKSTYIRAEIGGYEGRRLNKEDVLELNKTSCSSIEIMKILSRHINSNGYSYPNWLVSNSIIPNYKVNSIIRIIKGGEFDFFDDNSKKIFFENNFIVTPQSDRMGYRLKGQELKLKNSLEMISEAVSLGTIQVPPDGNPIILLADRQTTGGYPKIGQAITVDMPIVSQLKPGDSMRFEEISLEEAQRLYIEMERNIEELKTSLKIKINAMF